MLSFFLGELKTGFFEHKKGPPRFPPGLPSTFLPQFPQRFLPGFPPRFLPGFPPRFLVGFPPRFLQGVSPQHSCRVQIKIPEMIFLQDLVRVLKQDSTRSV